MARWEPDPSEPFGPAEHIGRRLFDEPQLVGATDQKPFPGALDIRNFEETRGDEFSVDRMGKTSVDRRVKAYLKLLAEAVGRSFHEPKSFDGWATAPGKRVCFPARSAAIPLRVSPENGNPYHAHLETADLLPGAGTFRHYHVALFMRELFSGAGTAVHLSQPKNQAQRAVTTQTLLPDWLQKWVVKVISQFRGS